jgi:hypothetical protein
MKMQLRIVYLTIVSMIFLQVTAAQAQTLQVYPGDANGNGVVNGVDFLYLGLGYNFVGPQRDSMATTFGPIPATPWAYNFLSGSNLAHADCNGDGLINYYYDAFPIYVNYGLKRPFPAVVEDSFPAGIPGTDPSLFFDPAGIPGSLNSGQLFSLPLNLGTPALPVQDLYGLTFSLHLDPEIFDVESTVLNFNQLSWANPDNDRVFMQRQVSDSRIDVSWVRTDHNQRSGFGLVASADLIIIIDVVGYQSTTVRIDSIKMVNKWGQEFRIAGSELVLEINEDATPVSDKEPQGGQLRVFPNPASEMLYLQHSSPIEWLQLYDLTGQSMLQTRPGQDKASLPLEGIPNGIYLLEIRSEEGLFTRKIIINRS